MLSKVDIFENAVFAFNGAFRITTLLGGKIRTCWAGRLGLELRMLKEAFQRFCSLVIVVVCTVTFYLFSGVDGS